MNPWAWIAAYVVGFALLQLVLYRYLGRDTGGTAVSSAPSDGAPAGSPHRDVGEAEAVVCEECGALNDPDPGFRFCRECAATLG